jgi:hypothetical protein
MEKQTGKPKRFAEKERKSRSCFGVIVRLER